jgi:hygromycin-B 4-O-kinase
MATPAGDRMTPALARKIARVAADAPPRKLRRLHGGLSNEVFRFDANGRGLVLRMHKDPARLDCYLREEWAMQRAREAGVPVPAVHHVGSESGWTYSLQDEVIGVPGTHWADRAGVLRRLGECAARIHEVHLRGWGSGFARSAAERPAMARWRDFLDGEIHADGRIALLERHGVFDKAAMRRLRGRVAELRAWHGRPVLQHGDLRMKNAIVSLRDGSLMVLLDWDNAIAGPPFWDLAIALHDVGPDHKEAFLEGYGMTPGRFLKMAPSLRTLNVLNYAWALGEALRQKRRADAAWLKARLRGVFDIGH